MFTLLTKCIEEGGALGLNKWPNTGANSPSFLRILGEISYAHFRLGKRFSEIKVAKVILAKLEKSRLLKVRRLTSSEIASTAAADDV